MVEDYVVPSAVLESSAVVECSTEIENFGEYDSLEFASFLNDIS